MVSTQPREIPEGTANLSILPYPFIIHFYWYNFLSKESIFNFLHFLSLLCHHSSFNHHFLAVLLQGSPNWFPFHTSTWLKCNSKMKVGPYTSPYAWSNSMNAKSSLEYLTLISSTAFSLGLWKCFLNSKSVSFLLHTFPTLSIFFFSLPKQFLLILNAQIRPFFRKPYRFPFLLPCSIIKTKYPTSRLLQHNYYS